MVGRPTKFTEQSRNAIIEAVRRGHYLRDAAAYGGVSYNTLRSWLKEGERDEGSEFAEFSNQLDRARSDYFDELITEIKKIGFEQREYRALLGLLKCRSKRWNGNTLAD